MVVKWKRHTGHQFLLVITETSGQDLIQKKKSTKG